MKETKEKKEWSDNYLETRRGTVNLHLASDIERLPSIQIQVVNLKTERRKDSAY